MQRPRVLVFDVDETLLDLAGLAVGFERLFGTTQPMGEWFARLLHGSLVANHTNRYRSFGMICVEALLVVAEERGVEVGADQAADLVAGFRRLPPHPDVPQALQLLGDAGFRMVTLSNESADVVADQMHHAGIAGFFEANLSVDEVRRFKPAPEVYLTASVRMGVEVDGMLMVTAHDWDIIGARSVGMPGAYLARPGAVWGLPDSPPELVAPDLVTLAHLLMAWGTSEQEA